MSWFRRDPHLTLLKRVHKLVMRTRPYLVDEGEQYFTLKQSIDRGGDDCDGNSTAIKGAMEAFGYEAKIREGWYKTQGNHSVVAVWLPSGVYVVCNMEGVKPAEWYERKCMPVFKTLTEDQLAMKWNLFGV